MAPNKIRALRTAAGLTQRDLAKKAQTSQQQIQRIEAGIQSARFDLAARICEALGASMQEVFPRAAKTLAKARRKAKPDEDRLEEDMQGAGIDIDPAHWFFKFRLRGGVEDILPIGSAEKKRLWSAVQRSDLVPFVVFDSNDRRVVLNLDHLLYCQFLFEGGGMVSQEEADKSKDEKEELDLRIDFADGGRPQWFGIDPDEAPLSDESAAAERMQQFQHMLFMLEHSTEKDEVFNFEDTDGEHVFFRGTDIAMLSLPLWSVEPELWSGDDEDDGVVGTSE